MTATPVPSSTFIEQPGQAPTSVPSTTLPAGGGGAGPGDSPEGSPTPERGGPGSTEAPGGAGGGRPGSLPFTGTPLLMMLLLSGALLTAGWLVQRGGRVRA